MDVWTQGGKGRGGRPGDQDISDFPKPASYQQPLSPCGRLALFAALLQVFAATRKLPK